MMWTPSSSRSGIPTTRCCGRVIRGWLARGRAVFVVVGQQEFSFFAPDFALAAVESAHIDLYTLERTRTRAPQAVVSTPIRCSHSRSPGRAAPPDGHRCRDACRRPPVRPAGLPWAERDGDPARGTFRWTGPQASLTLPGGEAVTLVVAGTRPPGIPPAEISVWIGERLVGERVLGETPQTIRLDQPETGDPGPIDLTIQSTVFNPRSLGLSSDPRDLGVRLYRVAVELPPERPAP